jgi:SAM-dependent methyltransferase
MTDDRGYTDRLAALSGKRWKRALGAQAPYRWNLRRVVEGTVLDVGCGIGRNLIHLDGNGVGVDTNRHSVETARQAGLVAYTADDFEGSPIAKKGYFGSLLFAHVLEHMTLAEATALVAHYLQYLEPAGLVVVIVPQEAGFASDPTHVDPVGEAELAEIALATGLEKERVFSFPLPRAAGRLFRYNETVALMRRRAQLPLQ